MIKSTYQLGGDMVEVIVRGNELLFFDISSGMMTTVEGLKMSKGGSLKEFPELKDDDEWKKKVIQKLKDKIKEFNSEIERVEYVKNELIKHGYKPLFWQRAGFRPSSFK